ncbi:MAG: hypothetical protein ACJAUG_003220 [Halioglobus sp.]|jgi:hypothetical protein
MLRKTLKNTFLFSGLIVLTACASTPPPHESTDGLILQPDTKFGQVYKRPGADLTRYAKYGLVDCQVNFKKNWMRDQNSSRINLSNRVTKDDVENIKESLSEACDEQFKQALENAPAYNLVESFDHGDAIMVLRPNIVNLDVNSPDVKSTGMSRSYTTEAGEMTLVLELLDGSSGEVLVRIMDRESGQNSGRMQWTNSITNKSDANRILKRWAEQLRKGLDAVTSK